MDRLTQTTERVYEILNDTPVSNLYEYTNMKYMKSLCTHIHNLVLIHNVGISDEMRINIQSGTIADNFELRQPIIDKFIKVTQLRKEKLEKLIEESSSVVKELRKVVNTYIELLGVKGYVSKSPTVIKGVYKVTVKGSDLQTRFIEVTETTYSIITQIDILMGTYSTYLSDKIVEAEYENIINGGK